MRFFTLIILNCFILVISTSASSKQKPTAVFVADVERVFFVDKVEALGTLQATENVNLTSAVTERITKINFEDNQRVKKGYVLVEMDITEENAELAEESSRFDEAQSQVERVRALVRRSSASKSTLDERERELNTAKARLDGIQSRINRRRIVAPFDGVVGIRNISVGALAQPGMLITTIDDDSKMKVDFLVPEVFLSSLKIGLKIEAKASAYPNQVFNGTVSSVDSRVDPVTRSVMVRAVLNNDERLLKGGMLMRVQLNKNPRQALIVPEEALVTIGSESAVMVVEKSENLKVKKQIVELGTRRKGSVEILNGIQEGQQVVTHGGLKIRDGSLITIQALDKGNEALTELLKQKTQGSIE
jgi:membrane fusion protein (multidrug efflux system)|tara:strand:+ start:213 stop:1292 length:1080 start_codon:yes stop_codon:yes gene_type:complete